MSLFNVLISDSPLKEVDHTGIIEITVRELKKLYPITKDTPQQSWHLMDDDSRILHAPDESAFGELSISACTQPPFDLEFYIEGEDEYVYWIGGNWKESFLSDFADYVKANIKAIDNVQLLTFWAGDGKQKLKESTMSIADVTPEKLAVIGDASNIRVRFL